MKNSQLTISNPIEGGRDLPLTLFGLRVKKGEGFTITEVLGVVAAIGLLTLVSIPLFVNYQKTTKLKSEARVLATDLRLAQQKAITEQKIYNVTFSTNNGSYQIINTDNGSVVKEVVLNSEVTIADITNLTNDTVQFNPTGAVIETGSVILTNTKNETSTIEIKPSGYVTIVEN